jgi:hypothetical protein
MVFWVILRTGDRPHSLEPWCEIQLRTLAESDRPCSKGIKAISDDRFSTPNSNQ